MYSLLFQDNHYYLLFNAEVIYSLPDADVCDLSYNEIRSILITEYENLAA